MVDGTIHHFTPYDFVWQTELSEPVLEKEQPADSNSESDTKKTDTTSEETKPTEPLNADIPVSVSPVETEKPKTQVAQPLEPSFSSTPQSQAVAGSQQVYSSETDSNTLGNQANDDTTSTSASTVGTISPRSAFRTAATLRDISTPSRSNLTADLNSSLQVARSAATVSNNDKRNNDVGSDTASLMTRSAIQAKGTNGQLQVTNVNPTAGTFDVLVYNVAYEKPLDKVLLPTWTESGGQDDIVWHTATRQNDGSYKATISKVQHKNETGKYHVHLYYRGKDASIKFVASTTAHLPSSQVSQPTSPAPSKPTAQPSQARPSVSAKTSGRISIENVNQSKGSFDVVVREVSYEKPLDKVLLPTWTESGGQDDIVWHTATRQNDGSYKVTVNKGQHKNETGKYHVHLYYRGQDASIKYISSASTALTTQASPTANKPTSPAPSKPTAQPSQASPSVSAKTSGRISIENVNQNKGSFDVVVREVSYEKPLDKVLLPTWTESGGQDDIVWHTATRQNDGSYKVTVNKGQHKNETGKYHVHLYYRGQDASIKYISSASTALTTQASPTANKPTSPAPSKPTAQPSQASPSVSAKTSGRISIENVNQSKGSFDVVVREVSYEKPLDKVLLPTWTESGGQDDIVWHTAARQNDGSYKVTVNKGQHKNETGKYHVHLYYRGQDASIKYISSASTALTTQASPIANKPTSPAPSKPTAQPSQTSPSVSAKTSGRISIENVNQSKGSFDVVVREVSYEKPLDKVLLPTWTESGGQDDIVWHTATRQNDGSYKVTVNKGQHKNETGKYHVHLYYRGQDASIKHIASASTTIASPTVNKPAQESTQASTKTSGRISIENVNQSKGSFDVVVREVSYEKPLDKVLLPTWTESGGQDDIIWHTATRQNDGSYKLTVNKSQHKNGTGKYHVHLYYQGKDGKNQYIAQTTAELPAHQITSQRSKTIFIDPGHGGRDSGASYGGVHEKNLALSVSNKLRDNLIKNGYNVIMSRTGDQDIDFRTERSRLANQTNADLFISVHFNATGAGISNASGIETYWYKSHPSYQPKINQAKHDDPTRLAESEILANKVHSNLIRETGAVSRGVKRETFAVLRETAIPAILVELGFMDNPSELQVIKQESYHHKLANALTKGVLDWYGAVGERTEPVVVSNSVNPSTPAKAIAAVPNSQEKFIQALAADAQAVAREHSLLPSVMMAQAILESGWGNSKLASAPNHNLFGIKADASWQGGRVAIPTKEYRNNRFVDEVAYFRTYPNWKESLRDYGRFFTSTEWRKKNYAAFRAANDYRTAVVALQKSGYATDPNYGTKIQSLIEGYGLNRYDR